MLVIRKKEEKMRGKSWITLKNKWVKSIFLETLWIMKIAK